MDAKGIDAYANIVVVVVISVMQLKIA